MKVEYIVQNKVSEQSFEGAIYEWLSQGDYTPDDIIENIITEHNLMYFPVHFYKCSYVGTATASLGYNRKEYYYEWNESRKRQERKSRIVTDWLPHSQNAFGKVHTTVYAGDSKYNFMRSFVEGADWSSSDLMSIDNDAGRSQKMLSVFKIEPTAAWNQSGIQECKEKASREIVRSFPSSKVRNFNANLQFTLDSYTNVVLPFWVFMYDYNGKPYYVAVDGNNPSRISGVRPEDKARKNKVSTIRWLGWLTAIISAYFGAVAYSDADPSAEFGVLGVGIIIFIVIGIIVESIVSNIKNTSKKKRQDKLKKRREEASN
jgi:hypothetical protein